MDDAYLMGECLKAAATLVAAAYLNAPRKPEQMTKDTVATAKELFREATITPWEKGS